MKAKQDEFIRRAYARRAELAETLYVIDAKHRNPTKPEHYRARRLEREAAIDACERDVDAIRAETIGAA